MPEVKMGFVHPMVPFVPENSPDLSGKAVYLGAARHDPIVTPEETMRLERLFRECGAEVFLHWQPNGHEMGQEEIVNQEGAIRWILMFPKCL